MEMDHNNGGNGHVLFPLDCYLHGYMTFCNINVLSPLMPSRLHRLALELINSYYLQTSNFLWRNSPSAELQ